MIIVFIIWNKNNQDNSRIILILISMNSIYWQNILLKK